jgi:sporulation protein YlmC with PRC-barrel domain
MSIRAAILGVAIAKLLVVVHLSAAVADPIVYHTDAWIGPANLVPAGQFGAKSPAFGPDFQKADYNRGVWGDQTIVPPDGLVMLHDGGIIGRTTYDTSGTSFGEVQRLLVDPATGLAHYAVITSNKIGGGRYLPVPMSAVKFNGSVRIDTPIKTMQLMEVYSEGELERRYPASLPHAPLVMAEVGIVPARQVAVAPTSPAILTQNGDWVGRMVLDANRQFVGSVEFLVVDTTTNQIREAIVAAMYLDGRLMSVPATNVTLSFGKVLVGATQQDLASGPRYDQPALIARYGRIVN